MKKRKNLKKKILGISLATLLVGMPFMSNNVEKVKADDTCSEYTNYYLFLGVGTSADFSDRTGNDFIFNGETRTNPNSTSMDTSVFPNDFADGADPSTFNMQIVPIGSGSGSWTAQKFFDLISRSGWLEGDNDSGKILEIDSCSKAFTHGIEWFTEGSKKIQNSSASSSASASELAAASYYYRINAASMNLDRAKNAFASGASIELGVNRVIESAAAYQSSSAAQHPTSCTWNSTGNTSDNCVWHPAVLKLTYKTTGGASTDTHKLTIHYVEEGSNDTLSNDTIKNVSENATYNESCKSINGYTNVTTSVSGTMGSSDKEETCYYTSGGGSTSGYTLTINYLDSKGNKINNPIYNGATVSNPSTESKAAGSSYSVTCPPNLKSGNTSYILDGKPSNARGTITGNVTVNCNYTTESAGTADLPIFIVWAVGGAALAYSIYFFRKYYKEQNEV